MLKRTHCGMTALPQNIPTQNIKYQLMPSTKCMFQERHTGISEAGEILEVLCVNSLSKAEEMLFAFESILIIRTSHLTFLGLLLSWRINKLHH